MHVGSLDSRSRRQRRPIVDYFWRCSLTKCSCALAVPFLDPNVGRQGKGFSRQVGRETLPVLWIFDREVPHGILHERYMLLRPQQYLYRLPSNESSCCKRRNRRRGKVVDGRLERMLAAYRGIYPRYRWIRHVDEESCSTASCQPSSKIETREKR